MERIFGALGALLGFLAVAAGAFGAHYLKHKHPPLPPDSLRVFETAVHYQFYHALALLFVAWACTRWPAAAGAGWCFLAGTILFSGSLHVYAIRPIRAFALITPVGGVLLLAGWLWLVWAASAGRKYDG